MKYRTIKVSELAASSLDTAACSILKKFLEYADKERLCFTGTTVKNLAIAAACKDKKIFTEKESDYFIANNVEKAIETAEYLRQDDRGFKPIHLTNPFAGTSYEFALYMVQNRISEIVDAYMLYIDNPDTEIFNMTRFASYLELFGKTVVDTDGTKFVKAAVPDLAECGFEGRIMRMYSKILKTLANGQEGLTFDDVVLNNNLHPERSTTYASNTLKASLYACLTQKNTVIADWYTRLLSGEKVLFDTSITNPIKDIKKIESAYLVDRVLIILAGDLYPYNIQPDSNKGTNKFTLDAKTKEALLDILKSNPETESLKTMFEVSKNWTRD